MLIKYFSLIILFLTSCVTSQPNYSSWEINKDNWVAKDKKIESPTIAAGFLGASNATSDWGLKKSTTSEPKFIVESDIDVNIPKTNFKNMDAIAIIIGNKDYQSKDIPSVDFANRDADIVKKYVIATFGFKEENIIYELNATKTKLEAIFGKHENYKGKLYNHLKRGKSDIFIYYSGHGAPDVNDKRPYIVPSDADPQALALTGYPLQQLYDNIASISKDKQVRNIYIVIDACFSGATEKGFLIKNVSPIFIEVENPLLKSSNAVILTSSSGTEVSSWYPEKGHSMFTYFFLKAIKDNAEKGTSTIYANDVFKYVADESDGVPYYAGRLHGRKQTPQIMGDKNRILFSKQR
ncbi:MAG: caspase family protein [Nitrospirae bacterium]|nr:MAG: caspase family protein [Nitrospirota bacterium]